MTDTIFDYVIVGGGTAGSVLANRLSARPENRVLLIEAGIDTPENNIPPEIHDGLRPWLPRLSGDKFFWPNLTIHRAAEHPGITREPQFYEQGRLLGGGSSVNMVVSNRGLPRDYDEWQALGADGWDWQGVLPYFIKTERDADYGDDPLHGNAGPIPIGRVDSRHWSDFTVAATQALEAAGLPNIHDQNARFDDGYFPPAFTLKGEERFSAARGYLDASVRVRPNLSLWTESRVLKLLTTGNAITGVSVLRGRETLQVQAREVILTAGALQSPAILLRTGIGPAADLHALGIPVLADRPGVGRNLWEHSSIGVVAPLTEQARADASTGKAGSRHQLGIRASSGVDPATPSDLFLHIGADPVSGLASAVFWVNKPSSTGWLKLKDADPFSYPDVDFNLLSDPRDLGRLKAGLRLITHYFAAPSLAKYGLALALSRFAAPQPGGPLLNDLLQDEAALERYLRTNVGGVWAASGTARIGRADDSQAVVDKAGRVYGVTGLRVADASIMPTVPTANTNLPTLMLAEKIADAILTQA
uniref:GLUCOSE-METHANOL-CHOLINE OXIDOREDUCTASE n=1 Tax=Methylovorus sp. (strain MP688) TaxID=887061 RepID=UPI0005D2D2CA|nr:Chain A, Glucose-methanol-choline Oxidoreductase [Methylovorus sp. MP688]4UDR_B Chain B, Glucose-methanol-choline Oxidoreductase [Methylovorus sp. MP688]